VGLINEIRHTRAAAHEFFEKPNQRILLAGTVGRDSLPRPVDHLLGKVGGLAEPGLKIVERAHFFVDLRAGIQPLHRAFGQIQLRAV
jgi:hypothetical protein